MVISSNRSPSPTIRKENIDSRAQEIGVRKSFNGNPLIRHTRPASTPANSPTDFIRRSLGQKEGLRCSYDSKENEKDQKKMRDCERTKGGKSFMAPTISAISKISSPSPRKKVLSDRNEMVRSSISESEGKNFMGGGDLEVEKHLNHVSKPETGFDSQVISESHVKLYKPRALEFQESEADSPIAFLIPEAVSKIAPPVTSSSPSLVTKYDSATKNSSLKARPLPSPSSAMSPLDSDPHLPPYDPKTNYLSPRPQFLHYRPKPRVEVKKLEDSFPSDASISSDTETTEDTLSSGSLKESEEDSSSEVLSEISSTEPNHCPSKAKASPKSKSRSCFRSKTICLLLVFALACAFIPVSETPVLSPSAYKDQTFRFDELATVAKFARENLDGLASNIKIWSAQTYSYVSGLISGPDVVPDLGPPLHFSNWTIPSEPVGFDEFQDHQLDKVDIEIELGEEIMELEMITDGEDCEMVAEGKEMPLEEVVSNVESQKGEDVYPVLIETEELPVVVETEDLPAMITEDLEMATEGSEEVVYDAETQMEEIHSAVTEEHSPLIEVESLDSPPQHSEIDLSPTQVPELDVLPEIIVELDSTSAQFVEPDTASLDASSPIQTLGLDSTPYVVTATAAFVALVAILVCSYLKHRKPSTEVQEPSPLKHKKPTTEVQDLLLKNIMSSGNCEPQVEMVGESGPEMSSSFKRSLSHSVRVNEEAHSHEKRPRHAKRESLASSSDYAAGSVSYGSFYVPSKDVLGEDEVMTPVRRSSRIRKITSPSA